MLVEGWVRSPAPVMERKPLIRSVLFETRQRTVKEDSEQWLKNSIAVSRM
jgi:hypothetical protein